MMKINVLGGHGGMAKGYSTTSFLINGNLLVDAGGVVGAIDIADQVAIDHILITHCHLDHIKDLAFISDNCFGLRSTPFEVHTHPTVKSLIKTHLLNDTIWPDFTILPSKEKPTITISGVPPEKEFMAGEYKIFPVLVKHPHDAYGYFIEKDGKTILFTGDTGPTERIWEVAKNVKNLVAIFTEVSFPNRFKKVAELSDHHTARTMGEEIKKMPLDIPIILTHLKPNYQTEIMKEIADLGNERITILSKDGTVFNF